jgi:SPP1 gp7 family putative phage head morphogenesis protein
MARSEQEIDDLVNNVMRRCAGSNQEIVGRMRQIQSRARKRNLPPNETQAQMQALFKTLDGRYAFAIRDEMGNFVASVTERRHKDFGLTQYRWADRRDKSVRGNPSGKYPHAKYSHWHRNGDLFDYDDPPPDGNPGEPSGCRCMAQPEFPDQGQKGLGLMAYFLAGVAAGAANELSEKPA